MTTRLKIEWVESWDDDSGGGHSHETAKWWSNFYYGSNLSLQEIEDILKEYGAEQTCEVDDPWTEWLEFEEESQAVLFILRWS